MSPWIVVLPELTVIFAVWSIALASLFVLGKDSANVLDVVVGGLLGFLTKTALDQAKIKLNGQQ